MKVVKTILIAGYVFVIFVIYNITTYDPREPYSKVGFLTAWVVLTYPLIKWVFTENKENPETKKVEKEKRAD